MENDALWKAIMKINTSLDELVILGIVAIVVVLYFIYARIKNRLSILQKSILGNVLFICLGALLMLYPLTGYPEGVLILICINAIAAMGVSLLTGFTGILSFGHAAFMAIGAYSAFFLAVKCGVHWMPAFFASGVIAMIIAWALGVLTLKHGGDFFLITSTYLCLAVYSFLEYNENIIRVDGPYRQITQFTTRYIAVGFFTVMGLLMFNLINSKHGREFKAIRDNVTTASMIGLNTTRIKVVSLVISAFYCGIAGALFAGFMTFLRSDMFDMEKSIELTIFVVIGGLGSMSGTLISTTIITLVTVVFRYASYYRMLIYGLIFVLLMILRPEGILGDREIWEFPSEERRRKNKRLFQLARQTYASLFKVKPRP